MSSKPKDAQVNQASMYRRPSLIICNQASKENKRKRKGGKDSPVKRIHLEEEESFSSMELDENNEDSGKICFYASFVKPIFCQSFRWM